jgi:predicted AlkP superfamily phosphohydrolase/phosphomutase
MVTGYNSGLHGIFHFNKSLIRHDAGTGWKPVTGAMRGKDPFWRILSQSGQRVGVINVPITFPADSINGFMLAGMDAPGVESSGFAHPADLLDKLRLEGIDYLIDVPSLREASRRNRHRLPGSVQRLIDTRCRTILHFIRSDPWDILMGVFVATDRVQHYFWPQDITAVESSDWIPIRSVYRLIDDFFGKALALMGEDTTVLVVSDHGFGPSQSAKGCLNQLFRELGLLRFRQKRAGLKSRLLKNLLVSGRKLLPYSLQDRLARRMPALHLRAVNEKIRSTIDWSETNVFASPGGGRVWINLKGRSPEGRVAASDYHSLCEQVREILLNLTDPDTGRRAVREVHRREEVYRGPYVEEAPDLLIKWDLEVIRDNLCYSGGERSIIVRPDKDASHGNRWNGSHRPEGVFIAHGPHIKQGVAVADASIYDITPTVLYLQNRPVPLDTDGKVLTGIFTEERLSAYPVQWYEPERSDAKSAGTQLNREEERQIEERLRGLGYIE